MNVKERLLALKMLKKRNGNEELFNLLGIEVELEKTEEIYGNVICINNNDNHKEGNMFRRVRNDCTVGMFEKKQGFPPGTFRNPDGRDTRSDKLIRTVRKEKKKK